MRKYFETLSQEALAVPPVPPRTAAALLAQQLRASLNDATSDVDDLSGMLGKVMNEGGNSEALWLDMIGKLQFFDLLSQRVTHIAELLQSVAEADGLPGDRLPDFTVLRDQLWQLYSCESERLLHRQFVAEATVPEAMPAASYPKASR